MKPKLLLSHNAIYIVAVGIVNSQKKGIIKFDTKTFDFGKISEDSGKVFFVFKFTNIGNGVLKLNNVKTNNKHIKLSWSEEAILPDKKGEINLSFNPIGSLGDFSQTITVISNASEPEKTLIIKGEIFSTQKPFEEIFPNKFGNLLTNRYSLYFGEIKNNVKKTDTIKIYNDWNKPITFCFLEVPVHLNIKTVPTILDPGKQGAIIITYDAYKQNKFGLQTDLITVKTNDSIQSEKKFVIYAKVFEDFSKLTSKELEDAPIIKFVNDSYDFGTIKQVDAVKYSFEFKNEGKNNLIIRNLKTS